MTLAAAMRKAAEDMSAAGLEAPLWQAKVLAAHLLDRSPSQITAAAELSLSPRKEESFFSFVARRIHGEPLQHIIGNWDFFGRTFMVSPHALIPRPETELLVEKVLQFPLPQNPLILDAGTGSGVIGITLAMEISGATVVATDISPDAASLALKNAKLHRAVNFLPVICNLTEALSCPFDLIAANLPYIPTGDIQSLPPVVRDHDPGVALDGGENGISLILELVRSASRLLKPGGLIILETGSDQETTVTALFREETWNSVETHRDLAGNHRFVTAIRRKSGV